MHPFVIVYDITQGIVKRSRWSGCGTACWCRAEVDPSSRSGNGDIGGRTVVRVPWPSWLSAVKQGAGVRHLDRQPLVLDPRRPGHTAVRGLCRAALSIRIRFAARSRRASTIHSPIGLRDCPCCRPLCPFRPAGRARDRSRSGRHGDLPRRVRRQDGNWRGGAPRTRECDRVGIDPVHRDRDFLVHRARPSMPQIRHRNRRWSIRTTQGRQSSSRMTCASFARRCALWCSIEVALSKRGIASRV